MRHMLIRTILLALLLSSHATLAQVVVTVGGQAITGDELELAVMSSPFAVQFPTMEQDQQAALRGEILQRMVTSRLFYLEAKHRGLDHTPGFIAELNDYRIGLLYQAHMDRLRNASALSAAEAAQLRQEFTGEPDAAAAAQSQRVNERLNKLKTDELQTLRRKHHAALLEQSFDAKPAADTVLAKFDGGQILYRDISHPEQLSKAELRDEANSRLDTLLFAQEAERNGADIKSALATYRNELLPGFLMMAMEREWIPDLTAALAYYDKHPEIGRIPAQQHVLQIVVAERKQAEALRQRLLAGENFYELALKHSIDPYGRKLAGDMGWLPVGSGVAAVEQAIAKLPEGGLSPVIETPHGFHLVKVEARKLAYQKNYDAVADRVRQAMIQEHLPAMVKELSARYPVEWKLPMTTATQQAANKPAVH